MKSFEKDENGEARLSICSCGGYNLWRLPLIAPTAYMWERSPRPSAAHRREAGVMVWFAVGLLILGAACGATIRLMVFIVVLLVAGVVAAVSNLGHGVGVVLLSVVMTIVALQVGYVGGLVLRARAGASRRRAPSAARDRGVRPSLRERRR